jgi:uncharacterized protein YdeI (YjbR/CyaY-like superfamily)
LGWVKVRGRIDDFELNHYKLMPEQKAYLDWIYEVKKEDTKAERIVKMMVRLADKKLNE